MNAKTIKISIIFFFISLKLLSQNTITGKVLDGTNSESIVGVTVWEKGTINNKVLTNINGNFKIVSNSEFPVVLVFSYIGYDSKEVNVQNEQVLEISLLSSVSLFNEVIVTARRRSDELQEIPISMAVISGKELDNSTSFNVNRVKELVPSVQLYSSNPRNTTLNIRGLGSTFGLTNDGIDPGVGFYVDGVYYARPAATTLDFIDVQQIEVLRGPQGTLFGKNTTAGTFNIISKKPTFVTTGIIEQSFGNFGFIQTKGTFSGPLIKDKLAVRLSFSGTHRDGNVYNIRTDKYTNTLNNQGIRGQILWLPTNKVSITIIGDYTRQRPDGYAQVFAGVASTKREEFRQFESIISDLNYDLPSRNPFDRIIDHDTPSKSNQDMGGVSLNADFKIGKGVLTSTTAWRIWEWDPSSDRDFTGLSAIVKSQAPSIHHQLSQEIRFSGNFGNKISGSIGIFAFYQQLNPDGAHILEAGPDQWRFIQNKQNPLWETPGLLDGFTQETKPRFRNFSGAIFGQLDWKITKKLTILPGLRLNYDQKEVDFEQTVYGGLETTDPNLIAIKKSVFSPLSFKTNIDDWNLSGQITLNYSFIKKARIFATYSLGFKPVGLNLGGIPLENGEPMLELAVVKPEQVNHFELGFKSEPFKNAIVNFTGFYTDIQDYQTNVRSSQLGVSRGYLANAEQVVVTGAELELSYRYPKYFKFNTSISYTDGRYISFKNAPVPLEETGGDSFKDISGEVLPGISKWAVSSGFEIFKSAKLIQQEGEFFLGVDVYYRSSFSSSPSASKYLNIDGYALINSRLGFRATKGISIYVWIKNIANKDYFEQLLPAAGDAGHYAGVLGDPRTYGITLRYNFSL